MKLTTYPMTRELMPLREALDRIVGESLVWPFGLFDGPATTFAVDLTETKDSYVLTASLPGVKPEDVDITATTDSVSIAGEYKTATETKDATYVRQERQQGVFKRSFTLPLAIVPDKIDATQADGILTITMPKAEVTKPARVQIKSKA